MGALGWFSAASLLRFSRECEIRPASRREAQGSENQKSGFYPIVFTCFSSLHTSGYPPRPKSL
jgi:hypothetical protein